LIKLFLFFRELTFRKGDIIFVKRQIDKNWYEGEHNAMIGLFPINYVEVCDNATFCYNFFILLSQGMGTVQKEERPSPKTISQESHSLMFQFLFFSCTVPLPKSTVHISVRR
jgi:hypothetical protein